MLGEAGGQVRREQRQHLGLRRLAPRLGGEHRVGDAGEKPGLFGEIGAELRIGVDPFGRIERLQPDLEQS